jgi:hypothetical protein
MSTHHPAPLDNENISPALAARGKELLEAAAAAEADLIAVHNAWRANRTMAAMRTLHSCLQAYAAALGECIELADSLNAGAVLRHTPPDSRQ